MSVDKAKIRFKIGEMDVEYEGEQAFLEEGLVALVEKASKIYQENQPVKSAAGSAPAFNGQSGSLKLGMNSVAAKLGVKTGPDLTIAAAASLTLVKGQDKFSRKDLTNEMRAASSYFKENMVGNLTKILSGLVKDGRLNDVGSDSFALSAQEISSLEAKLA